MKTPEQFVSERHRNLLIVRRSTLASSLVLAAFEQQRNRQARGSVLKEGKRSSVALLPFPKGEGKQCVCGKYYPLPPWPRRLGTFLVPSRAMRSFRTALRFQALGIKTAMPLALIEKRDFGLLQESFLLMEDLSPLPGMPEYLAQHFSPPLAKDVQVRKKQCIRDFAHFLRKIHEMGVYQTDFKTTNIFVEELPGGRTDFHLVDLDQVVISRKVSVRGRVKNLCQINTSLPAVITLADRLRFYQFYWGKTGLTSQDRRLIRRIIRMSGKRNPEWHPRFRLDAARIRGWQ